MVRRVQSVLSIYAKWLVELLYSQAIMLGICSGSSNLRPLCWVLVLVPVLLGLYGGNLPWVLQSQACMLSNYPGFSRLKPVIYSDRVQ